MTQTVTTKARTKAASTAIKAGGKAIVINIHNDVSSTPHARVQRHRLNYPAAHAAFAVPHIVTTNPRLPIESYNIPEPKAPPSIAGNAPTFSDFAEPPSANESLEGGLSSVGSNPDDDSQSSLYRSADDAETYRDSGGYNHDAARRNAESFDIPGTPAQVPQTQPQEGEAPENVVEPDIDTRRGYDAAALLRNANRPEAVQSGVRRIQREVQTDAEEGLPVNPRDVRNLQDLGAPVPDIPALIDQALNQRFPDGFSPQRGERGLRGETGAAGATGSQGAPGRVATRRELLDAANEYVNSQGGIEAFRGPRGSDSQVAGPPGRSPTAAEIRQAVDQFMTEHGQAFVGRQGEPGRDGLPGADSTVPGPPGADSTVPGPQGPAPSQDDLRRAFDVAAEADPDRYRGRQGVQGDRGFRGQDSQVPGPPPTTDQLRRVFADAHAADPDAFRGGQGVQGPSGVPTPAQIDAAVRRRMQNFTGLRHPASEASTQYDDAQSNAPSSSGSEFSRVSRMTAYYDALSNPQASSTQDSGYYTPGGESSVFNSVRSRASSSFQSAGPGSVRSQASILGSIRERSRSPSSGGSDNMADSDSSSAQSRPPPRRRRRTADERLAEENAANVAQNPDYYRGKSQLGYGPSRRLE